jgi:serine/threonine-protein kinase
VGLPPESPPEQIWPPGRKVAGRYRITRPIGRGGMGVVYAAVDETSGESVALKVPFASLVRDEPSRRRFAREARMATRIGHENAVKVLAVHEDDGRPVMVMELLDGQSLTARLEEAGRLSLGEAARILVPVLGALADAHARGIVHRDIKPDNIFLARKGGEMMPKVLDFGVAKLVHHTAEAESMKLTITGAMLGTPYYMAPEQAAARAVFDHRVDLWAMGVVLYEVLAGARPFDGVVYGQIFAAIFGEEPRPIRERAPELPDDVVRLIEHCLRKNPQERPPSAGEIAEVLAAYASLPATSYPKPGNTMHGVGGEPSDPAFQTPAMPSQSVVAAGSWSRRRNVAAAALALLAASAGGWLLRSRGRAAPALPPAAAAIAPAVAPAAPRSPVAEPAAPVAAPSLVAAPRDAGAAEVAAHSQPTQPAQAQRIRPHARPAAPTAPRAAEAPAQRNPATGIIDTL